MSCNGRAAKTLRCCGSECVSRPCGLFDDAVEFDDSETASARLKVGDHGAPPDSEARIAATGSEPQQRRKRAEIGVVREEPEKKNRGDIVLEVVIVAGGVWHAVCVKQLSLRDTGSAPGRRSAARAPEALHETYDQCAKWKKVSAFERARALTVVLVLATT